MNIKTAFFRPVNLFRAQSVRAISPHTSNWGLYRLSFSADGATRINTAVNLAQRLLGDPSLLTAISRSVNEDLFPEMARSLIASKAEESTTIGMLSILKFDDLFAIATYISSPDYVKIFAIDRVPKTKKQMVAEGRMTEIYGTRPITEEDICSGVDPAYVSTVSYTEEVWVPPVYKDIHGESDLMKVAAIVFSMKAPDLRGIVNSIKDPEIKSFIERLISYNIRSLFDLARHPGTKEEELIGIVRISDDVQLLKAIASRKNITGPVIAELYKKNPNAMWIILCTNLSVPADVVGRLIIKNTQSTGTDIKPHPMAGELVVPYLDGSGGQPSTRTENAWMAQERYPESIAVSYYTKADIAQAVEIIRFRPANERLEILSEIEAKNPKLYETILSELS